MEPPGDSPITHLLRPTVIPKPLTELAELLDVVGEGLGDTSIVGVTLDSRRVADGDLYAALAGAHVHGAQFAEQAAGAGAVAILTDEVGVDLIDSELGVPVLVVDDPREVLGKVSSWVYDDPSAKLKIIGVTGTDGKTTVAMLAEAALQAAGLVTGLIGTVVTRIGDRSQPAVRTTPEAPDLHALLAVMIEHGVEAVAMEVSSHALALGRVSAVAFDVAVFTNLGHDHLDFHGDQEHYFEAKASLFTPAYSRAAVVCVDDEWGERLANNASIPTATFSVLGHDDHSTEIADWTVADLDTASVGWKFRLLGPQGQYRAGCRLPGLFNVSNAVAATVAVATITGDISQAASGVAQSPGVPGRMEQVGTDTAIAALVDYAHTPDAVARAIAVGRTLADSRFGRLIVVLGCGGDRDTEKRPLMGAAAARGADVAIITDDNPRTEDPAVIRREMMAGMGRDGTVTRAETVEIGDRVAALRHAVAIARDEDVILALGKGHEATQEVNGIRTALDDRLVLGAALTGEHRD